MKKNQYFISYLLMVVLQLIICNYLNLSQFVTLSVLPLIILCLPYKRGPVFALLLAFVTGLAVDYLPEGIVGLNAFALTPVALLRRPIISLVFGSDVFARKENISLKKHGIWKMSIGVILSQSIFLLCYIAADGAGTRPFWFNASRFSLSLIVGCLISVLLSASITSDERER